MHETAPWFLYNPIILATYSFKLFLLKLKPGTFISVIKSNFLFPSLEIFVQLYPQQTIIDIFYKGSCMFRN